MEFIQPAHPFVPTTLPLMIMILATDAAENDVSVNTCLFWCHSMN